MSFDATEKSTESGSPVELYEFTADSGIYRYTSAADDVVISGVTYAQVNGLTRDAIQDAGDIYKSSLSVTAPEDFLISSFFEAYPPSDVCTLAIKRVHLSDLTDVATIWLGRILTVAWAPGHSTLTCESVFSRLKQPGLRRVYARTCPYVLYGNECKAVATSFQETAALNALSADGFQLTSATFSAHPDGYYGGGKLTFDEGAGVLVHRGIRQSASGVITITHPIATLTGASIVVVNPGCDHTKLTCQSKFGNLVNFGGFPYIPPVNPYTNSVF